MSELGVVIAGKAVPEWTQYDISIDLGQPAASFALTGPFTRERYEACALGAEIQVSLDGRPIVFGYITSRRTADADLTIRCHDRVWRMTLQSAPLRRLRQDTLQSLAEAFTEGIFDRVVFSNAENRALYRAGNRRVGKEPPIFSGRQGDPVKVPLDASLWTGLAEVLRRAELLAWSSADGRSFVIARPNHSQEPLYSFELRPGGTSTCRDIAVDESIESRVRTVELYGKSRTDFESDDDDGPNAQRRASATDASYPPLDISKRVIEEARDIVDAQALAQALLDDARRDALVVTVSAWSHDQGRRLFAVDTVADVIDERIGFKMRGYVIAVNYSGSRSEERSELTIVPLGTRMVPP